MGLTVGQQQAADNLAKIKSQSWQDWVPSGPSGTESQGISANAWSDQNVVDMMNAPEGTYTQKQIMDAVAAADKRAEGGPQAVGQANYDDQMKRAEEAVKWWNEHPNGHEMGFMDHLMGEVFPMVVLGGMGAGALGALGSGGAALGAGAGEAAAGAGTVAAGTGAATAGGGLTAALGDLAPYVTKGLTSMGIKAGTNVLSGKPLTSGLAQAGLFGGLGAAASGMGGNFVGDGLKNLGFSPDMIKQLTTPITTAGIAAGTNLIQGKPLSDALKAGLESGVISYGGNQLTDFLNNQNLGKPAVDILSGAGKGAIGSVVKGRDPLTGLLTGATNGAINYGAGALGSGIKDAMKPTGNAMPDNTDETDWLGSLYSNLDNPSGSPYSTDFTNYGNPTNTDTNNINDVQGIQDYLSQYLSDGQGGVPNIGAPGDDQALAHWLQAQGTSLVGDPGRNPNSTGSGGTTKPGFLDNLLKQLGGIGTAAGNNPLAAIAALIGGAGTLRNAISGPPSDLGKVDALMAKGATQMNSPVTPMRGQVVARDPRFFTQQYGPGNVMAPKDYTPTISDMYKSELGRDPEQQGMDYWKDKMNGGLTTDALKNAFDNSEEYKKRLGGLTQVGG